MSVAYSPTLLRVARGGFLIGLLSVPSVAASEPGRQPEDASSEPRYEFGAVLRMRAEARSGIGEDPVREDGFAISRLRLDFTMRPSRDVKVFIQGQDSRAGGLASLQDPLSFRNPADLRQGYVAIGREDGPWTVYAGRRELSFLGETLVGRREWSNVSPTWDGAMLGMRRGADSLHLLGYSRVEIQSGLDSAPGDYFMYGVVGSIGSWMDGQMIEPFLLATRKPLDRASNLGGLVRTVGSSFAGTFSETWDYRMLLAAQGGGERDQPQRAWLGEWALGKTLPDLPARPRLSVEWTYASGDQDPLDGRTGTFDPLFPAPHRVYGEQDVTGLRNLKSLKAGIELSPSTAVRLNVDYFDFRLASVHDALYQTDFEPRIASPSGGAASSSIGSELDLVLRYALAARVGLRLGVSRFFAGRFVTQNLSGGESQTFVYTALELRL